MIVREMLALLGLEVDEQSFAVGELAAHAVEKALDLVGQALEGLAKQFAEFLDEADQLSNLSAELGISVERLQELRHAGAMASVPFEELVASLRILGRNAAEAAKGSETMVASFTKAGIKVKDAHGKIRPIDDLFASLADKLQTLPEGPARVGLAMDLLGRSGARLVPAMKDGSAGLKAMADEAHALGEVMSADTVAGADELGDTFDRLGLFMKGMRNQFLGPIIPDLLALAHGALEWAKANREVIAARIDTVVHVLGGAFLIAYRMGRLLWSTLELLLVDMRLGKVAMVALALATLAYAGNALRSAIASAAAFIASMIAKITVTETYTSLLGATTTATRLLTLAELQAAVAGAAAPYLIAAAWGALLIVLGLIIEDVYTFFKGGDSLFGRFGKWVSSALQFSAGDSSLVRFLKWLGMLVFDTAGAVQVAGQQIRGWARSFIDWISEAFNSMGLRIGKVLEPVSRWFNILGKVIGNVFQGKFREALGGALELFQPFADAIQWVNDLMGGLLGGTIDFIWERLKTLGKGAMALLTGDLKGFGHFVLDEMGPVGDWAGKNITYGRKGNQRTLDQLSGRDNWTGGPSQLMGQYMGRGASGGASVSSLSTSNTNASRSVVNAPSFSYSPTIQVGPGVSPTEITRTGQSQFDEWMNAKLADGLAGLDGG